MASVIIHGFKSDEAAQHFISWYSAQGEQYISVYLECVNSETVGSCVNVDWKTFKKGKSQQDEAGNFVMHVINE